MQILNKLIANDSEYIKPNSSINSYQRKLPISDVELFPDLSRKAYHILPSLNNRRVKASANSFAILEEDKHKEYKIIYKNKDKKFSSALNKELTK